MKTQLEVSAIIINHQPYGEQHPYNPLATERSPRDPIAGDDVTLGIETSREPAASSVWCVWQIEGQASEQRSEAVKISSSENFEQWQVQMPAFHAYEQVHYRLFGSSGAQIEQTQEFSFTVLAWEELASIVSVEQSSERLTVKLATSRPGLFVNIVVETNLKSTTSLKFSAGKDGSLPVVQPAIKDSWAWEAGGVLVSLTSSPIQFEFRRESDGMSLKTVHPAKLLVDAVGSVLQYHLGFESPADEAFYGFGERFNALDQRGNTLDNYVFHQFTGQGKYSYIPIPFFISSRGYGFWLKTEGQAQFDLAATHGNAWTVTGGADNPDACLEMDFFHQPQPKGIIQSFTDLTGKPKLPPTWVFGLWMSSNDWNNQVEVLRQLQLAMETEIPASVLVIEAWSDEINFYIWNDAEYQQKPASQPFLLTDFTFPAAGRWPNPKAMVDQLHDAGIRLVLWQNPTIKQLESYEQLDDRQNQTDQAYAIQQGYVVKKADGSPHRAEPHMPWFRESLVLDFSNPAAAQWWFKKREYLVTEMGVDGFKTDGGEHIWDLGCQFYNGSSGNRAINTYPLEYEAAYQNFMEAHRGADYVLFSRAGFTGSQKVPTHWTGDENSTWEAFRASFRAMLNAGLCGVPFIGWDLAGFAGPIPSSELYLRAAAFSVFCPIMQYHSNVNGQRKPSVDRTPWNIQEQTGDTRVIPTFRTFANLRMNLMPYLLGQAYESSQTGLPMMRPLLLEYPADKNVRDYPYQYLFGDSLLVAPVTKEGVDRRQVYLPAGSWRDFWTGKELDGPRTIEVAVPRDRIPVFQKQGSILALNLDESGQLGCPVGNETRGFSNLTLRIFPGEKVETPIYINDSGTPDIVSVVASDSENTITINLPKLPQGIDLVVYMDEPVAVIVNGHNVPKRDEEMPEAAGAGWQFKPEAKELRLHVPESQEPVKIVIRSK